MLCVPSVDPRISVGAIGSNWQIPLRLHESPATGPLRRNKLAKGRAAREDIAKMHVARHWPAETGNTLAWLRWNCHGNCEADDDEMKVGHSVVSAGCWVSVFEFF